MKEDLTWIWDDEQKQWKIARVFVLDKYQYKSVDCVRCLRKKTCLHMFRFTLWCTNIAMENQHFNRYIICRRALFHSKLLVLLAGISHIRWNPRKPNSIPVRCRMFEMVMEDLSHLEREHISTYLYHFFRGGYTSTPCLLPSGNHMWQWKHPR